MRGDAEALRLTTREIEQAFADPRWSERFPPVLTVSQAADLANVSRSTVYDWSSRGRLRGCARRQGRRLRIFRDRYLQFLFSETPQ